MKAACISKVRSKLDSNLDVRPLLATATFFDREFVKRSDTFEQLRITVSYDILGTILVILLKTNYRASVL